MRSAQLHGRDHHSIGALAAVAEGPAAITLSRGGYPKQYSYTEPNEDAALFAYGSDGVVVAVADGHHGAAGSKTTIAYLASEWAPRWTGTATLPPTESEWQEEALRMLAGANHALLTDAAKRRLPPAPTTLAVALLRPREGRLLFAGVGDSHVFAVSAGECRDVLAAVIQHDRKWFIGYEMVDRETLIARSGAGIMEMPPLEAVVLASDGISEPGIGLADPAAAVHEQFRACRDQDPRLRPLELARSVSTVALQAHQRQSAGDNMSSAVIWLPETDATGSGPSTD